MSKPSILLTPSLEAFIERHPTLCKAIYANLDDFQALLVQLQREITTSENRDIVGPTVLALKHVDDTFELFAAKGAVLTKQTK